MKIQKLAVATCLGLGLVLGACGDSTKKTETTKTTEMVKKAPVYSTDDPQSMLAAMEYAHGGWGDLWSKGDVEYIYDYRTADGKADVSTERYVFATEASYGNYKQHQINVMPTKEGEVTQYFDGEKTMVMMDGKPMEDPQVNGVGDFLRKANYFWFVMPYKLNDKGTISKYLGQEDYNGTTYDKLEVTYDAAITGKEQNDIYILYVNPTTKLVDRFYFSLPFMGVTAPVLIANYSYEDVEGQMVATKRTYFMPNAEGAYGEEPSIVQTLSDIKFGNNFTKESIMEVN